MLLSLILISCCIICIFSKRMHSFCLRFILYLYTAEKLTLLNNVFIQRGGVEVTISNQGAAFKDDMLPHTTLYTKQFEATGIPQIRINSYPKILEAFPKTFPTEMKHTNITTCKWIHVSPHLSYCREKELPLTPFKGHHIYWCTGCQCCINHIWVFEPHIQALSIPP